MDISLQWTPNSEPDVAGYKVYYREQSQSYDYNIPYWETIEPKCTIYDLDTTKTYYFVVRAFDIDGFTSSNSNEVILREGIAENGVANDVGGGGGGVAVSSPRLHTDRYWSRMLEYCVNSATVIC